MRTGGRDGGDASASGGPVALERDATFALLSYSFNLNPALRHQLAHEMTSMV